MTEIKVDNIVNVAGTGKPNFPVAPTHSTGSALSTLNTYQYDTTTRVVTVVDDNGTDKFAIDGVTAPTITLFRGVTYTFDVSDSSVSTHPLAFKNAGTSYTTGITSSGTAGTAGATVTFAVAADAPLTGLTYYCTTHGDGMGSSVTTSDPNNGAMLWDGAVKFYVDSEFKNIGTSSGGGDSSNWSVDLSNVSYDNKSFSVATIGSQNTSSWEVDFNTDGTKMYVLDSNSDSMYQLSLSTAWDITTASYDNVSYSAGSQGNVRGSTFSADGTKLFIIESTGAAEVHQYSLSTAWDLSTVSYDNISLDPLDDVSSIGTYFYSVAFSTDGTKMFAAGSNISGTSSLIISYSLSTGYDLSTASYDNISFNHSSQTPDLKRIVFNSDGTQFFKASGSQQKIYQYSMTTAYDLSTASYDNKTFSTASQETGLNNSMKFSTDGTKMYTLGPGTDTVYQYSTESGSGGGSTYSNSGDRGVFFGGTSTAVVNVIEYVDITTPGNAQDFGDLTETTRRVAGCSNGTRGLRMGNVTSPGTTIDYVTISTTGNAQDFGDLTLGRYYCGSFSDGTYGFTVGGTAGSTTWDDTIDYVTISTTGNATDFGNTTVGCTYVSGLADDTRGVYQLGSTQSGLTATNNIEYITTATPGNGTDFGDLTNPTSTKATGADTTRGIFAQGYEGQVYTDVIEYITIQTTGNATDFGDATIGSNRPTGTANSTRMLMASGNGPAPDYLKYDTIAYITIQTTGNATDFGDLSEGKLDMGAFSGAAS